MSFLRPVDHRPRARAESHSPVHVAIIMDGNRRWARARGLPVAAGHREGAKAVQRTVESCVGAGVRFLTLYAFSSENWGRPAEEVGELMNLMRIYIRNELDTLHKNGIRVRMIGERERFAPDILELIAEAETRTRDNQRLDLLVALNYGARREIVHAAKRLAAKAVAGELEPAAIDEAAFEETLFTAGVPAPDLLIRTGGEQRISNFLLWQLAYTELVFLRVSWPEFTAEHLEAALEDFGRRERRYGVDAT
jgi:undecaprenyl diphosphate synthase